jgi:hypothetical protein
MAHPFERLSHGDNLKHRAFLLVQAGKGKV